MSRTPIVAADSTAERVALWRAMHVQIDPPPHIFQDDIGLKLLAPLEGWQDRPDMNPTWTKRIRASIVARARFVEDLLTEKVVEGVGQYVILGAGLDTFAQRKTNIASKMKVFEIDRSGPQLWKRRRLEELGYGIPEWLRFVPVDFEAGTSWWNQLVAAGFDDKRPAVIASIGLSMYLTREATITTLQQFASLSMGSTVVMSFLLPVDLVYTEDRAMFERAKNGATASGTPFISFFAPTDIIALAKQIGFKRVSHISAADYTHRYFANRNDDLRPSNGEELLVAET